LQALGLLLRQAENPPRPLRKAFHFIRHGNDLRHLWQVIVLIGINTVLNGILERMVSF
jgi:hypothetical protein